MQVWFLTLLIAAAGEAADTVVVCPPAFEPAMEPWTILRESQGHQLLFVSSENTAEGIRNAIRKAAGGGRLRHVVLVGDVPAGIVGKQPAGPSTPTHHVPARVNVLWGSEPEIATDNSYADLDGDMVPEVAVGRLSARTPSQLRVIVQKTLDYERSGDHGLWRRRINLVAGVGGFGTVADTVIEMATRRFITEGIPAGFDTTMTYASWQSPFCPDPRRFGAVALQRLNEGCLFWVYLGHGAADSLDHVRIPAAEHRILHQRDLASAAAQSGLPIALLLACYTGAYDLPQDCLAETMLRQPGGPVAVISGSRVSMPYAMAVLSTALMDEVFRRQPLTLGEAICSAKRRMMDESGDDRNRQLLDALAAAISPLPDQLVQERREHLALFNLLGDPLLRIGHPRDVRLVAPETADAGQAIRVHGQCDLAGRAVLEVVSRCDRLKTEPPARRQFEPSDEFFRSFDADYAQANDRVWLQRTFTTDGGPFDLELVLPVETRGPCYVRIWIEGRDAAAQGAAALFVRRPADE